MPLVYQQNINLNTRLGVWHIEEEENFFLGAVTLQNEINHTHKRLQHLAGRFLLKELYPEFPLELILVAETRKPYLENDPYHFSISHCGDYAATIVSRSNRVGVDIEIPQRKILVLKEKFLSPAELSMNPVIEGETEISLTICWSIKEAVFKWYGAGKVDFRSHIHIDSVHITENSFEAVCRFTKNMDEPLMVRGLLINGNCLAWVCT